MRSIDEMKNASAQWQVIVHRQTCISTIRTFCHFLNLIIQFVWKPKKDQWRSLDTRKVTQEGLLGGGRIYDVFFLYISSKGIELYKGIHKGIYKAVQEPPKKPQLFRPLLSCIFQMKNREFFLNILLTPSLNINQCHYVKM